VTKPTKRTNSEGELITPLDLSESTKSKLLALLGIDDKNKNTAEIFAVIETQTDLLKCLADDLPLTTANYRESCERLTKLADGLISELAGTHDDILLAIDMKLAKTNPYSQSTDPITFIQAELLRLKHSLALVTEQYNNNSRGRHKQQTQVMVANNLRALFQKYAVNKNDQKLFNTPHALTDYEQKEADFIATVMNTVKKVWSVSTIRRIFLSDK
jgi:hypothetical protein